MTTAERMRKYRARKALARVLKKASEAGVDIRCQRCQAVLAVTPIGVTGSVPAARKVA